jgi:hypothetical protein
VRPVTPGPRYDDAVADLDAGLDGVHVANPAAAHQLAGQTIAHVGALLATGLEGAVVYPGGLDHRLAFVDGERVGLLASLIGHGEGMRLYCG